jgi:hypothetical protein
MVPALLHLQQHLADLIHVRHSLRKPRHPDGRGLSNLDSLLLQLCPRVLEVERAALQVGDLQTIPLRLARFYLQAMGPQVA